MTRRESTLLAIRSLGVLGIAAFFGSSVLRKQTTGKTVWQIDPKKCTQCGRCETSCIMKPSAVKCVHAFTMCGNCKLCFGYFQPNAKQLTEAAENQICPTGAIHRKFIESPYFEYTIDEALCIGCGLCVKSCSNFGNGSLYLQIRHDRCVNCNACKIEENCPSKAIRRIPVELAYLKKDRA